MRYPDPTIIPWSDTRAWMPWAECADLYNRDPYAAALVFGEATASKKVDTQQREFVREYCHRPGGGCPVIEQCLAWADSFPHLVPGVYGGATEKEREKARRRPVGAR